MLFAAASARIGQWEDTTNALLEAEARYGALSDSQFRFRRADGSSESAFKRSLDALAAGDDLAANRLAFESVGQDAPYLVPLVNRLRLAQGLFAEGASQQAAPIFREILKLSPNFWPAELGLIKIELQSGDRVTAQRSLEKMVAAYPSAEEPRVLLALLLAESNSDRARTLLSEYLQNFPEGLRARQCLEQLGWSNRTAQRVGDSYQAVEFVEQVRTKSSDGVTP